MSVILDALRRKAPDVRGGERETGARAEAVLSTLGYTAPARSGPSVKALLGYCVAALATGFLGLWLLLMLAPAAGPTLPRSVPAVIARGPGVPSAARPPETIAADRRTTLPPASALPVAQAQSPASAPPLLAPRLPSTAQLPDSAAAPSAPALPPAASPTARSAGPRASQATAPQLPASATALRVDPSPAPDRTRPSPVPVPAQPAPVARAQLSTDAVSRLSRVSSPAPPPGTLGDVPRPSTRPPAVARPQPALETAIPAPPSSRQAPAEDHFGLALYYQRVGDFDNALIHYRALLELNDASAEVHNNLGLLYQDRGQVDDAVKQFQRAIAIDPRSVKAHNNLGVTLMRNSGLLDTAGSEFRVALALDPRNVESLVNLALVQKSAGRVADARLLLRRALTIDPRNPGSHYNLAVVADESGDVSTAIEHYRAFLRFGTVTHAELAGPVRARLTALGSG